MRLCHWFMRELKNATNRTVKKGFLECWAQLGVKLLNLSSELVQNKWELKQEGRISLSLSFSHPYFFHLRLIKEEQSLHLCPPSSHTLLMHHYEALASPHSHPFPGLSGLFCSSVDTLLLSFPARCTPTLVFFFPANVFSHILPLPLTSGSSWSFWCDGTGCRFNHRRGFTNKVNELKLHTAWRMVGGAGKQHVRCFQACSDFISFEDVLSSAEAVQPCYC